MSLAYFYFIIHFHFTWKILFCWKGYAYEGTGSEHEGCYGTFKKLVRYSELSKSDNFKKRTILAQILVSLKDKHESFFIRN